MKKKQPPKPRNPFVHHLEKKKQGAHVKSYKSQRRKDKADVKKGNYDKD